MASYLAVVVHEPNFIAPLAYLFVEKKIAPLLSIVLSRTLRILLTVIQSSFSESVIYKLNDIERPHSMIGVDGQMLSLFCVITCCRLL